MGNQTSQQDCIYVTAKTGNVKKLEEQWRWLATLSIEQKKELLEWKDREGKTALIIAASRGHTQVVEFLLSNGADKYYIAPVSIGGGPLHEAAMGRYKNLVYLLLQKGFNPFVENKNQQNALGYAIDSCNVELVRMFEQHGIYWGWMLVKVRMIMGSKWKLRWCVVVPRYSFPQHGNLESHALLLVYVDQHSYEPKIKAWLDNASVTLTQNNSDFVRAKLTLQIGHNVPSSAYTEGKPNTGVSLFFKSYDHSEQSKAMLRRFTECVNQNWLNRYPHPYQSIINATPHIQHFFPQTPMAEVHNQRRESNVQPLPTAPTIQHASVQSVDLDSALAGENYLKQGTGAVASEPTEVCAEQTGSSSAAPIQTQQVADDLQQIDENDEDLCVVCMNEPKTVGFAHGETVHRCIGLDCASKFSVGQPCPICKQPITLILKKFYE